MKSPCTILQEKGLTAQDLLMSGIAHKIEAVIKAGMIEGIKAASVQKGVTIPGKRLILALMDDL